jgi:hypothetical protein
MTPDLPHFFGNNTSTEDQMKYSILTISQALVFLTFSHSSVFADIRYILPLTLKAAEITGDVAQELRNKLEALPQQLTISVDVEVQCPTDAKDDIYSCNVLIPNIPNTTSPMKVAVTLARKRRADPAGSWSAKMLCYELAPDKECIFTKNATVEQLSTSGDDSIELRKLAMTANGSVLKSHIEIECPAKTDASDYSCALSFPPFSDNNPPTKVTITGPTARILRSKGELFFRSATPGAVKWMGYMSCITGENRCEIIFGGSF